MKRIIEEKGQVSIEFIAFLGVMLLILAVASFAALNANSGIAADNEVTEARRLASTIAQEINIAVEIGDGYFHVFNLPATLNGVNYSATITSNRFVLINWKNKTYSLPVLATNFTGTINTGQNSIRNSKDVIVFE